MEKERKYKFSWEGDSCSHCIVRTGYFSLRQAIIWIVSLLLVWLSACGGSVAPKTTVTVGSKEFAEQIILGEMYALILEDAGFSVERKLALGGSPALQEALVSAEIDLYPEYTGTGLMTVLKLPVSTDAEYVYDTVAAAYEEKFDLLWLDPAPMNNTYVLVMTEEKAAQYGIRTISDMVAQAGQFTMAGTVEFATREDGLPGLKKIYGDFELARFIPVEPDLKYRALIEGEADIITGFGTDGEISAFDLAVLKDDRQMYPPYQVAPVVRRQILEAYPEIGVLFNRLAPKLTSETMQFLNYEVSGKGRKPSEVALEFLVQNELIDSKN